MNMSNISGSERFHKIYSALFSTAVLALLISFVNWSKFSLSTLATDFHWRGNLVHLYSSFRLNLGDHVFNAALIGKEGWIFYTGAASIQDYQKIDPLKGKTLNFLQKGLTRLSVDLKKRGITLVIVVPPDKSTIYPQYMPEEIPVIGERSRLDQFVERMRLDGKTNLIDLRPVLLDASNTQEVYFKADTHWNDLGAYYGYYEILDLLSNYDSRITPHPLSDYEYVYREDLINPDLPLVLGVPLIKEERWTLIPRFRAQETQTLGLELPKSGYISKMVGQDDSLPTLLVFHDSFYSAYFTLSHLMEPHFHKITGVLYTSDPNIWSLDWIEQETPDVVIIEIVERNFEEGFSSLLQNSKK